MKLLLHSIILRSAAGKVGCKVGKSFAANPSCTGQVWPFSAWQRKRQASSVTGAGGGAYRSRNCSKPQARDGYCAQAAALRYKVLWECKL